MDKYDVGVSLPFGTLRRVTGAGSGHTLFDQGQRIGFAIAHVVTLPIARVKPTHRVMKIGWRNKFETTEFTRHKQGQRATIFELGGIDGREIVGIQLILICPSAFSRRIIHR